MAEKTEITVVIEGKLEEDIAEQIARAVRDSWKFRVGEAVATKVLERLSQDDYVTRIADNVSNNLSINEEEFTKEVVDRLKDTLMGCVHTIATETLNKVTAKVKEYGFIKISDRF